MTRIVSARVSSSRAGERRLRPAIRSFQFRSDRACRRARADQGQALRWPRKTWPALTAPARGGCEMGGRDERTPAKLSGIDPHAWLADILARLVNLWPNNRLDELLPWTWADARQQQQRAA
jgi:hypothetical protein